MDIMYFCKPNTSCYLEDKIKIKFKDNNMSTKTVSYMAYKVKDISLAE